MQVEGGDEEDVHALAAGFLAEECAEPPYAFLAPELAERTRAGQQGGGGALVPAGPAHPGRAVGEDHLAQAEGRLGVGASGVPAGEQPHAPWQAELVHEPALFATAHADALRRAGAGRGAGSTGPRSAGPQEGSTGERSPICSPGSDGDVNACAQKVT